SQKGVSDDYYDVRNSIFNPNAALERKVELYANLTYYHDAPVINLFSPVSDSLVTTVTFVGSMGVVLHNNSDQKLKEVSVSIDNGALGAVYNIGDILGGELKQINSLISVSLTEKLTIDFRVGNIAKQLIIILQ
ncbi:MAG: hypothetical protein ACJAZ2_001132, partial [Glaciecola sp.]